MASNKKKDFIAKAVSNSIEETEPIDLLLISQYLDNINDEVIGTTNDYGMHYSYLYIGMSGQKLVDKMNENWQATDAQFLAHNNALNLRIVSNDIRQLKLEDGTIKYTTDGEHWTSLISEWGSITGSITDQTDLMTLLQGKASQSDLDTLSSTVSLQGNTITLLSGNVGTLSTQVNNIVSQISGAGGILVRLDGIDTTLRNKISSANVLNIRESSGTLQYTTDGTTWIPVSSAGIVSWGDIIGDIQNQPDLINLINGISGVAQNAYDKASNLETNLPTTIQGYTDPISQNLNSHIGDTNNPHNVTKEQLGIYLLPLNDYNNLQTIDNSGLYIVDDTPERNSILFVFNTQPGGGGTYDGEETYKYNYNDIPEGQSSVVILNTIIDSSLISDSNNFTGFIDENSNTYTLSSSYTLTNGSHTLSATWTTLA